MNATTDNPLVRRIRHLGPCSDACRWLSGYRSAAKARGECPKGSWMLWLIGRCTQSEPWSEQRKPLLACALDCAETVLHLWPDRQREQIESGIKTLRNWIAGKATVEDAKRAREGLYSASRAAAAAAAADAARKKIENQCVDIVRQHFPAPPKVSVPTRTTLED